MTEHATQLERRLKRAEAARQEAEYLLEQRSEELFDSVQQIRANESILNNALGSMADGFLFTNERHEVVVTNDRMREMYPSQAACLLRGENLTGAFGLLLKHPAYVQRVIKDRGEAIFVVDTPEGKTVSVSARFTRGGMIASIHRDITTQWAAENERRRLLLDVLRGQRLEAIGRMSKLIAHDFNNIIASIRGYTNFILEDLPLGLSDIRKSTQSIMSATCKAEELISQIINFGKMQELPRCDVSLVPVVEDAVELCEPLLHPGIVLESHVPEVPVWVLANEGRLSQLFGNLLTNAITAMGKRTGKLLLCVEPFKELDLERTSFQHELCPGKGRYTVYSGSLVFALPCVRVAIVDTGCGMEPEVMEKMFELYFTTSETKSHGGLGMSSVADIVSDFSGGIKVTSKSGEGTAVELVLPLGGDKQVQLSEDIWNINQQRDDNGQILVLDDDEIFGNMLKTLLQRNGFQAVYRNSSAEGLRLILEQTNRWKLIISDQKMPAHTGSELFRLIRNHGIKTPFVLCSADAGSEEDVLVGELKENFLSKPIDEKQLLTKVSALVR